MEDRIRLTIEGGIADVRLSRADKLNALDPAMFKAIAETGRRLKDDLSVRAVVLSGEGRGFCVGLDLERMMAAAQRRQFCLSPISPNARMAWPILPSTSSGCGESFQCR